MSVPISKARRRLLVQMESILGNECYNGNIQNYGPGGVRESDGRGFRYPITVRANDGSKAKIRETSIPASIANDTLLSGYYAFGANQLDVMAGLDRILTYLEKHQGLIVDNTQE